MKILVTVGPKSGDESSLKEFSKKTKLFSLNGSHATLEWHSIAARRIREVCPEAFILLDIPGIKPRTENIEDIFIENQQEVVFGSIFPDDERLKIGLTREIPKHDEKLENFSLNDCQFEFDFVASGNGYIVGKSRSSSPLCQKRHQFAKQHV